MAFKKRITVRTRYNLPIYIQEKTKILFSEVKKHLTCEDNCLHCNLRVNQFLHMPPEMCGVTHYFQRLSNKDAARVQYLLRTVQRIFPLQFKDTVLVFHRVMPLVILSHVYDHTTKKSLPFSSGTALRWFLACTRIWIHWILSETKRLTPARPVLSQEHLSILF